MNELFQQPSQTIGQMLEGEKTESTITKLLLDLNVIYLRKVHAFCYYSGEVFQFRLNIEKEYDDERMLSSKCGPIYIRTNSLADRDTEANHKI